jgi:aspartyl/asparaginyl-tRNA synthetase
VSASYEEEQLAFDARVVSVLTSKFPERLNQEHRTDEGITKANVESKSLDETTWERLKGVNPESLVHVTGRISSLSPKVVYGDNYATARKETTAILNVTNLTIVAEACPDLPSLNTNELDLGERLNNRILDLRNAGNGAIIKLLSETCQLIVEFLSSNGFHWIHTPRIISHTVTGDKEYFHLPYFGGDAWLAQNSQYQNQTVLSMDMQRIFDIGPAFRAEKKSRASGRHLTEVCDLHSYSIFAFRHYKSPL